MGRVGRRSGPKKTPTMQDVASLAGVSRTTVSFVLNEVNTDGIPEGTREKVRGAARELGYRPNAAAKQLRTRRSHTIGFITDSIASEPYSGDVIRGAQETAWDYGKVLIIVNTNRNEEIADSAAELLLERRVEGLIYAADYHQEIDPPSALKEAPAVMLDCYAKDRSLPSVVPDEVGGGRTATEALVRKGHRRIAFVNLQLTIPAGIGRLEGYKQALTEGGLAYDESLVRYTDDATRQGYEHTIDLMGQPDPPTAIFYGNDRTAMEGYDALKDLHLRIPADVAVVGFDNQELVSLRLRPPLSTVALPHYEMGRWAIEHLIEQADARETAPVQHTIPCPYVERESAG